MFSRTISLGLLKTAFKYHFKGCEFLISSCFLFPTNECQKSLFIRMFHAWYVWASEGKAEQCCQCLLPGSLEHLGNTKGGFL